MTRTIAAGANDDDDDDDDAKRTFVEQGDIAPGDEAEYESLTWSELNDSGESVFHIEDKRGVALDWENLPDEFTLEDIKPLRSADLDKLRDPATPLTSRQRDSFVAADAAIKERILRNLNDVASATVANATRSIRELGERATAPIREQQREILKPATDFMKPLRDHQAQLFKDIFPKLGVTELSKGLTRDLEAIARANDRLAQPPPSLPLPLEDAPRDVDDFTNEIVTRLSEDDAEREGAKEARAEATSRATIDLARIAKTQFQEAQQNRIITHLLSFAVVFGVVQALVTSDETWKVAAAAMFTGALLLCAYLVGIVLHDRSARREWELDQQGDDPT